MRKEQAEKRKCDFSGLQVDFYEKVSYIYYQSMLHGIELKDWQIDEIKGVDNGQTFCI